MVQCPIPAFCYNILTRICSLDLESTSSSQIRNLAKAKVAVKANKIPSLLKGLTTIAGIDLGLLGQDRPGLKFDEQSRKAIVLWMVENDCTEPSISGKHLQLVELEKKLGFDKEGLPDAYRYMLQDKLKRDIGILKKQLMSTMAIGYWRDKYKKGNKQDPTFFFPFTQRWLLPKSSPNHIPLDLDLTWDPEIVKAVDGDMNVLNALASVSEFLLVLSDKSQVTFATLMFKYPQEGFKGFPAPEDPDSEDEALQCYGSQGKVTVEEKIESADNNALGQTAAEGKSHESISIADKLQTELTNL